MAGPTVKEILLKFGIDTSTWRRAIADISTLLEQQQSKAAKAQQDVLEQLEDQKAAVKDLIALQQDLTEELQRQAQIRSQTKTDDSGGQRVVHEKTTTDHIRRQVTAHKDVQDAAEESGKTAAEIAKQQKQIADEIKKQSLEIRAFITAQKNVQTELASTLKQEQLISLEIKKQVADLQKLSTLRAPTAWKPTYISTAPAPVARGTVPTQAPAAAWQSDLSKLQGGIATGAIKAGSDQALKLNQQIRQEIEKRMAALRQIPNLTNAEIAEVNKLKAAYTQLARIAHPTGKKEGNFFTEFASGFTSRFAGTLAFAVFSAEGLGRILETLTMKMKAFIESTGPLTQVREQFEKLATTQNVNPTKFIEDLRTATKGLVDDTSLYRTANQAMQSGLGTSSEKIVQLTQATVGLARANGKDAKEALEALNMFMTTGYARTLGRVTGLQSGMLVGVRSLGGGFDQSTRLLLNFNEAAELVIRQYKAIGEPALTYTERLKQIEEAQHRFGEELALSLQKSAGFQKLLEYMGEAAEKINKLTESATTWGDALGVGAAAAADLFQVVGAAGGAVLDTFKAIVQIGTDLIRVFSSNAASDFSARFSSLAGIFGTIDEILIVITSSFKELGNAITWVGEHTVPGLKLHLLELAASLPVVGLAIEYFFRDTIQKAEAQVKAANDAFLAREKVIADETDRKLADAEKLWRGKSEVDSKIKYRIIFTAPDTRQTELQVIESEQRMGKVKEQLAIKTSQAILQTTELRIKREEDLLQSQYEDGLITLTDYLSQKRSLEQRDYEAKMAQLRDEFKAKKELNRLESQTKVFSANLEIAKARQTYKAEQDSIQQQLKTTLDRLHGDTAALAAQADPSAQLMNVVADKNAVSQEKFSGSVDKFSDHVDKKEKPTEKPAHAAEGHWVHPLRVESNVGQPTASQLIAGIQKSPASFVTPTGTASQLIAGIKETPDVIETRVNAQAKNALNQAKQIQDDIIKVQNAHLAETRETALTTEMDFRKQAEKLAEESYQKIFQSFEQEKKDEQSAQKTLDATAEKLVKDKITNEKLIVEDQFKDQEISAQEYLTKRVGFIEAEFRASENAANIKFEHGEKDAKAEAARLQQFAEAEAQKQRELTKLDQDQWEIRTKAEEDNFANSQKLLDAQLSYQKQLTPIVGEAVSNQAQAQTLREILDYKRQVLEIQEQEVQRLKDTNQEWFTQQERVLKTKEEVLKYNEELIRAQAPLQGLSEIATNLSEGFGALRGKGMAGISQELGQFAQNIGRIQKQVTERNLRASQLGGGFWAQFGFGKPKTETAPLSPADREKALGASLANADDAVKGAGSVAKSLEDAISTSKDSVKNLDEQIAEMASTIAKAIETIRGAQLSGGTYVPMSRAPGDSVTPEMRKALGLPGAATGAMVVEGGVATIHAGEQISPASEVMALVTAVKAAATELTRFTTNLDGLTKALGKLGESPWAGQPRGTAPPAGARAQEASTSVLKNIVSGVVGYKPPAQAAGGPDTRSWIEKLSGAQPFYSAQETGGAPVKKTGIQEWLGIPFKKPAASTAGLSGPPTAATPLMSPTKSDTGDASQTLMSMGSFGEALDAPQQAQNAALIQNIGATQQSTSAMSQLAPATQEAGGGISGMAGGLSGLSGMLGSATQVVGGFQQALSGAGGPGKSALAGAQAGFQLGSMIPGPAGAVVGGVAAGIGAIVGVFAGKARDHTEKIAKQLEAAFQANTAEVQNGSQTLKGGIAAGQALIATTVQELTGQKGGKQIMESVLPQMNQALDQLKQQQQQILTAFHDKLEVASSPIAYQDQLGQIQGIIQQYQQYIQAGGSVANANQFLQQSFQTLAQNGINQLNQSEQDAINNALSYNDLLLQRQDLIQNTNLQIQQIMSQGVAVRQAPQGVTKAAQIQQVVRQATEQQQNLDAEISTSKYKLDNEAKIFNLASTRVGLEQQLVNLQNQQTNLQLESTEALGNVVHQMQTALPTSMPAALAGLGLGAAYVPPEAAQAPIPPVKTGIKSVDIQAELEYQQELAYYQQQQNLPVGYINPAGSPAGSVTTGTAGNLYTGPTPGVPTTSPYPSSIGSTASQDQINQAIAIINAGKVGQPLNQPPNTTIPIGGGLGGPPSLGAADIIATPDGQAVLVTMASGGTALADAMTQNATAPVLRSDVRPVLPTGGGGGGTPTAPIPVGAPGSPPIPTPPIYRPQPQPGGGGPPAGPITFPTPIYPGGVVPEQQIPGQGGVPGTGITGVTVNPDGSLSFGQLPTSVLTPVDVGTGPGTTQDVGIIGTPPEVQAGITSTFSTLESVPIPTLVNPLPLPGTGGPPPPPPRPTGPPPIDTSAITAALDAAVAGDVQAEKVTMNQFIAILNNIDSVGIAGTITALQAFHDNFAANHSGPQSRSAQRAMQVAINSLIQMALAQPAPVAPLSPITTVTGLPTQPTPSTPGLTPQQIMELNQRMDSTVLQTGPAIGPPPTLPPVAGTAEWLNGLTPQQQQAVPPIPSPTSAGSLTQPPDTVSTPLGQALVVTEGNATTASTPTAANSGGTTFTVSQTPTSPMPTTPPPAGMFWAWAGSSWQPEPSPTVTTPPALPTSPVIGPAPVVPPVGAPIHVGAAPVLGGGTAPTFQQSPANAPPPPANIGVYQTFTDDQGNVWAWQPRTMVDPIDGGIANGYWYLSSPGTPPTPVILPTPTPQPIYQPISTAAPTPPPAPANQAATQTFTDPQGNVWTWVPAHTQSCSAPAGGGATCEAIEMIPGHWQLTTAITPTPPIIAPTPISPWPIGGQPMPAPPIVPTPIAPTTPAKPNFGPQEANFYSTIGSFPVPQAGFQNLGLMLEYQIFLKLKKLMDGVVAGTIKPSDALVQVGQLKSSPIVGMLTDPSTLNAAFDQATAIFTAMMSVSTVGTGIGTGTPPWEREGPLPTPPPPGPPILPSTGSGGGARTPPVIIAPVGQPPLTPGMVYRDSAGNTFSVNADGTLTGIAPSVGTLEVGANGVPMYPQAPTAVVGQLTPLNMTVAQYQQQMMVVPLAQIQNSPEAGGPSAYNYGGPAPRVGIGGTGVGAPLPTSPIISPLDNVGVPRTPVVPLEPGVPPLPAGLTLVAGSGPNNLEARDAQGNIYFWNGTSWYQPSTRPVGGGIVPSIGGAIYAAAAAAPNFLNSVASNFLPTASPISTTTSTGVTSDAMAHLSATTQRVTLEAQINALSSTRVAAETQLVSLKMQEIQADMARVAAHRQLLATIKSSGNAGNTLEELMNGLYQTRSRQGFGGFNGEISNPV